MWLPQKKSGRLLLSSFQTIDGSLNYKDDPDVRDEVGFDLYRTSDGVTFEEVTTTGFGDRFAYGVRTLEATPYGLFLGTANDYYGLRIWRAAPAGYMGHRSYLPLIKASSVP